jgi:protein SCO1
MAQVGGVVRRLWDNRFMSKPRHLLYLVPLLLAAAAAGYMVSRLSARETPELTAGTALPVPRALPPFMLTDQDGAPFDNARLAGRPSLVFVGFTNCPDVCPTTLALMAQLHRQPSLSALRPVFITVDPERDDARALKLYVNAFGAGFTGLRGDPAAFEPLLAGLGAAYAHLPLPGGSYAVDHSATLFYLNAHGEFSAAFTPPFSLEALRRDLESLLASGH